MTRLDRVIKAFNDYDEIVEELSLRNSDNSQNSALEKLRNEVLLLVDELKRHGCRRCDEIAFVPKYVENRQYEFDQYGRQTKLPQITFKENNT